MKWKYAELAKTLITTQKMIPLEDVPPALQERLEQVVRECSPWVKPYLLGVTTRRQAVPSLIWIYAFDMARQDVFWDTEGLSSTFDDAHWATIGLSTAVLARDIDETRLVFLHELSHLRVMDHGPDFVLHLNQLLFEFNERYGTRLRNDLDYSGSYVDDDGHPQFRADSKTRHIA